MKVSRNLHKGAAVAAAIVALLFFVLGIVINMRGMVNNFRTGNPQLIMSTLWPQIVNLITVIITAVVLLRGKKDVLGGILFLVCALIEVIRSFSRVGSIIAFARVGTGINPVFGRMVGSNVANLIISLVLGVFYLLIALECFKPGKISSSGTKVMLFILPVAVGVLNLVANLIIQGEVLKFGGRAMLMILLSTVLSMIIRMIPLLLAGIAFATPVYEQPQMEQGDYTQTYPNV